MLLKVGLFLTLCVFVLQSSQAKGKNPADVLGSKPIGESCLEKKVPYLNGFFHVGNSQSSSLLLFYL